MKFGLDLFKIFFEKSLMFVPFEEYFFNQSAEIFRQMTFATRVYVELHYANGFRSKIIPLFLIRFCYVFAPQCIVCLSLGECLNNAALKKVFM